MWQRMGEEVPWTEVWNSRNKLARGQAEVLFNISNILYKHVYINFIWIWIRVQLFIIDESELGTGSYTAWIRQRMIWFRHR